MRLPFWRRAADSDLDDEIRTHLQMAIRERIARGESPAEADASARREFGNVGLVKEVTRDTWGWQVVADRLLQDARYACRLLAKQPVARGTKAIGVRVALGASQGTIVLATLRHLWLPVTCGLFTGSALAWWGGRLADRFMYGIRGSDSTTLGLTVLALIAAAAIAALVPARRALRINPVDALRAE